MKTLQDVLTKEYLAKLGEVSLRLRHRLSMEGYAGNRRTMAKGSSLEFSDYREYMEGDDLRRVDWNGYARFGKLYLKLYLEEKQAAVNIFLDCSRSMSEEGKFLAAKQLAASLAYIGLNGGDRVQVFGFRDSLYARPQDVMQQKRFLELVQFLDGLQADGTTDILRSVTQCGNLGRGITVVISDFMTDSKIEDTVKLLQYKKQEVLLLQVLSTEEESPQQGGAVRLVDMESGETRDLELTPQVIDMYTQALKHQRTALREFCRRRDAVFYHVNEQTDLLRALYELLQ